MEMEVPRRARVGLTALALLLTGWLAAPSVAPASAAQPVAAECATPGPGEPFRSAPPAQLDLDPAAVQEAIDFATGRAAAAVQIYRHGCLAGAGALDGLTGTVPNNVWSTTKGVVSVLTGRAQRLGRLDLDDPIGRYLPEADPEHGAITVRQLLTESSGLHFIWTADLHLAHPDSVRHTLALPFDHEPGSYFEYAQTTVSVLAKVVERAVGEDLQAFAQRELFGPLGIDRREWFWLRDRAGNTHGWAHLFLSPHGMARVGHLMLGEGAWAGRRLLDRRYVTEAQTPSSTNSAYGYLLWTNRGDHPVTPSIPERRVLDHPIFASAPRDTYAFVGFGDQMIWVIPSLDMVIVRTGLFGNRNPDPQALITANTGDWMYEFFRILMRGVRDRQIPDPGPFQSDPPAALDLSYFVDLETTAGSLGLGPAAPPGCNALGCDGRLYYRGLVESGRDALRSITALISP
jgi:CubicO group peptidase (beta-lactamase class C family)